jgi:Protein of unknown function (DUF1670)
MRTDLPPNGKNRRKYRDSNFGRPEQKTLHNVLKRELVFNFGYEDKLAIADLLVERLLALVKEYSPDPAGLQPGQVFWLAVDVNAPPTHNRTLEVTDMVPVILTLVSPNDLKRRKEGQLWIDIFPDVVARLFLEAYQQGGVLAIPDIVALCGCCYARAQRARQKWEKKTNQILPTRGVIHDLGSYPTHKAQIVSLHLQGLNTQEIGRLTYHAPECVDRYLDDFERVLILYRKLGKGRSINKISFYSGLSIALVKQYYAIIKEHPELLRDLDDSPNCQELEVSTSPS